METVLTDGLVDAGDRCAYAGSEVPSKLRKRLGWICLFVVMIAAITHGAVSVVSYVSLPRPQKLTGTERIEPGDSDTPWFTISPEERWIAFMEVDSAFWDPEMHKQPRRGFHLVTMELATGVKTHHHLNSLPRELFPPDYNKSMWHRWTAVQMGFETSSWYNGRLLVALGSVWISFTPGIPAATRTKRPPNGTLRCSDCPSPDDENLMRRSRRLDIHDDPRASVAYRNGSFSGVTYVVPLGVREGNTIERVAAGVTERVARKRHRWPFDARIASLRVSPDERFLTYTAGFYAELNPLGHDEIYVRDLTQKRERRVHGFFPLQARMGNALWSEDSQRLYFAGYDFESRGVFRLALSH